MKHLFSCFLFCLLTGALAAQNLISNPGFESNAGSPSSFFLNEVSNWMTIDDGTGSIVLTGTTMCGSTVLPAPPGGPSFARISNTGPIVNRLSRPVMPNENLTLALRFRFPATNQTTCTGCNGYLINFYLSNNDLSGFSNFNDVPAADYIQIGSRYVSLAQSFGAWNNIIPLVSSGINPLLDLDIDPNDAGFRCSYRFLIIDISLPNLPGFPQCSGLGNNDFLDLDDISLTGCTFQSACTYDIVPDVDGVCSRVQFTSGCDLGNFQNFAWNFGDGNTNCDENPTTHQYDLLRNYITNLYLVDQNGCVSVVTQGVNVNCERCEGIEADFTNECMNCYPMYEYDLNTHQMTLIGYNCEIKFTDASTPSPGGKVTNWSWEDEDGNVLSTAESPQLWFGIEGEYGEHTVCLVIQDENGCVDKICHTITVPCGERGSAQHETPGNVSTINVTPNPTSGWVTVRYSPELIVDGQHLTLAVFDLNGRNLKTLHTSDNSGVVNMDLSDLPNGMYTLHLVGKDTKQVSKIVIQR